jgi:hypothetical protein
MQQKLLTVSNFKLLKSVQFGYHTVGLHLAPHKLAGGKNLCPGASPGCIAACLNSSGMGKFKTVQSARVKKTKYFLENQESFMRQLYFEIKIAELTAEQNGLKLAVRLNTVSDVLWENILIDGKTVFEHFSNVNFYDYSSVPKRFLEGSKALNIPNYHLTFSRKENNQAIVEMLAKHTQHNIAVVFDKLPKTYLGRDVVDGDNLHGDLRFLDPQGVIVGLVPKGKAKKDLSGFVVLGA